MIAVLKSVMGAGFWKELKGNGLQMLDIIESEKGQKNKVPDALSPKRETGA